MTHIAARAHASEHDSTSGVRRRVMAVAAALLAAALVLLGITPGAFAAGTVTVYAPTGTGTAPDGSAIYESNKEYPFQIGYGAMASGQSVVVEVPAGLTVPASALVVPPGNTAVSSLVPGPGNSIVVTFASPFPSDINQGVLDLKFKVDQVTTSAVKDLTWKIDGAPKTFRVTITKPGDTPSTTSNAFGKSAGWVDLSGIVSIQNGQVVLDEATLLAREFTYTLTSNHAASTPVTLSDTLGAGLTLVPGSLTGMKVVRDANGLNAVTTDLLAGLPTISGASFTHAFTAEANSRYTFTYKAKVNPAQVATIRAQLQTQYNAVAGTDTGGTYSYGFTNTASDGSAPPQTTTTTLGGSVAAAPAPTPGSYVSKTSNLAANTPITLAADGTTLDPALPVTYTLKADLRPYAAFAGTKHELTRNVVISDSLPAGVRWADADAAFLSASGVTLTRVTGVTDAAAFAADAYVGTYSVLANGTLLINVGKDTTTNAVVTVVAEITSIAGASEDLWNVPLDADRRFFGPNNSASFTFSNAANGTVSSSTNDSLVVRRDLPADIDDPAKFDKSGPAGEIKASADPTKPTLVPYTFTVGSGVGDITKSTIVDRVDHSVFDVTVGSLQAISDAVVLKYAYYPDNQLGYWPVTTLDSSYWDLTLNADGNLEFAVNAKFAAALAATSGETAKNLYQVTISLPLKPVVGRQTLELTNNASLMGADSVVTYISSSTASATSFGNEMEVRKRVYDAKRDAYTSNLRAEVGSAGDLIDDTFVYRVELIPHGTFTTMVEDVEDMLPAGVTFEGFVNPADVATGTTSGKGPYTIPGTNIVATYDAAANQVTVARGTLTPGKIVPLYFKVKLSDYTVGVGITNVITGTSATITPTNAYPLSLLKLDAASLTTVIDDPASRFELLAGDQTTVIYSDLRAVDGKLQTAGGQVPTVSTTGTYWVREKVAPTGYALDATLHEVTVAGDGSSADVRLYNTKSTTPPQPAKTYAIGDVVWVDTHVAVDAAAHGQQGEGVFLAGVTVNLEQRVGGVWAKVATTTTDAEGRYLFDALAAGEYRVQFVLTDAQAAVYEFTTPVKSGVDAASDSDAGADGYSGSILLNDANTALTKVYDKTIAATQGIDPTWDAGVVRTVTPIEPGAGGIGDGTVAPGVESPSPAPTADGALPATGGVAPVALTFLGLLALTLGAIGTLYARRHRTR